MCHCFSLSACQIVMKCDDTDDESDVQVEKQLPKVTEKGNGNMQIQIQGAIYLFPYYHHT